MKISDKTDEDVAAILGLIPTPVAAPAEAGRPSGKTAQPTMLVRAGASLAVVVLGVSGLIGWSMIRQGSVDGGSAARAARLVHGRSYANVLLDAPSRTPAHHPQLRPAATVPESRVAAAAVHASAASAEQPTFLAANRPSAARATRAIAPGSQKASATDDDASGSFEVAKAASTTSQIAPLAFQSDGIGDGYRHSVVEQPNFALTPAARSERLDALDAVRLLRQR